MRITSIYKVCSTKLFDEIIYEFNYAIDTNNRIVRAQHTAFIIC